MTQVNSCVSEPTLLTTSLSRHLVNRNPVFKVFFAHLQAYTFSSGIHVSLVHYLYAQPNILHKHREHRTIGTHMHKVCFKIFHSFKIKGVANAKKLLSWLVDCARAWCSIICCQFSRVAKLLFPFPDSASNVLLSEIG